MRVLDRLERTHFVQMFLLEQRFYGEDHITPAEQAFAWYVKYPYTTIAAEDAGRIVGFVNLFPVSDAVLERLNTGSFNDKDLTVEDIADIHASQTAPLHMFLSCIVVTPEYRKRGLTQTLLQHAVAQYAAVEHRCDVIVTDNVTPEGNRFSRKYGFTPVCQTQHESLLHTQAYGSFCARVEALRPSSR